MSGTTLVAASPVAQPSKYQCRAAVEFVAKYGEHAYDQWRVDELLRLVARVETR